VIFKRLHVIIYTTCVVGQSDIDKDSDCQTCFPKSSMQNLSMYRWNAARNRHSRRRRRRRPWPSTVELGCCMRAWFRFTSMTQLRPAHVSSQRGKTTGSGRP
jgi:hypothetical protein